MLLARQDTDIQEKLKDKTTKQPRFPLWEIGDPMGRLPIGAKCNDCKINKAPCSSDPLFKVTNFSPSSYYFTCMKYRGDGRTTNSLTDLTDAPYTGTASDPTDPTDPTPLYKYSIDSAWKQTLSLSPSALAIRDLFKPKYEKLWGMSELQYSSTGPLTHESYLPGLDSARIQLFASTRKGSLGQPAVMKAGSNKMFKYLWDFLKPDVQEIYNPSLNTNGFEWLHLIAYSLGGPLLDKSIQLGPLAIGTSATHDAYFCRHSD